MCGRYTIVGPDGIRRWLPPGFTHRTDPRSWATARFNIAPSQDVLVWTNDGQGLLFMRWGLIPSWAKDEKIGYSMINARAESLREKPAFKKLVASRRCLIPADGFYEWRKEADGKTKTPVYFRMKSKELFAFAGLWDTWHKSANEVISSCTIITTTPNALTASVHDRMPVIIPRRDQEAWLNEIDSEAAAAMLKPYDAEQMEAFPVSRLVNSPRNDGPELLNSVTIDELF